DELRSELSEFAEPEKARVRSALEERVIAGFEEIQRFVSRHGSFPRHGEDKDIFERLYAIRLDSLRTQQQFRNVLAPLDHQGLLNEPAGVSVGGGEISLNDLRAELEGVSDSSDITELRHVRSSADKRAAEEIANRTVCRDFEKFKPR